MQSIDINQCLQATDVTYVAILQPETNNIKLDVVYGERSVRTRACFACLLVYGTIPEALYERARAQFLASTR